MWIAIGLIVGVVVAWLLVDRWKASRDARLHRGASAWAEVGPGRTFHSTGWEETVPPSSVLPTTVRETGRRRSGAPHST